MNCIKISCFLFEVEQALMHSFRLKKSNARQRRFLRANKPSIKKYFKAHSRSKMQSNIDSLSLFIEIINSLAAAYIVTEFSRRRISKQNIYQLSKTCLIPLTILNLIVSYISIFRFIISTLLYGISIILSPFVALAEMVGSSLIIFIIVTSLFIAYKYITSYTESSNYNFYQDIFIVSAISIVFIVLRLLGFDHYLKHTEALKILILICFFSLLLYIDIKRLNESITLQSYMIAISQSIIYSIFALPIIAIGISFLFLIIISIFDKLGMDTEHSEFLNRLVFYGTMYGPFYIIYWNAKIRLLSLTTLPI